MCFPKRPNSFRASTDLKTLVLLFTEPSLPTEVPERSKSKRTDGRSYEVDLYTPLGTTKTFILVTGVSRIDENRRFRDPDSGFAGCSHRRYTNDHTGPEDRGDARQAWLSEEENESCGFRHQTSRAGELVFAAIFNAGFRSLVTICDDPKCQARRESPSEAALSCTWPAFRELILTLISCWKPIK
jgi:hypothetical protein